TACRLSTTPNKRIAYLQTNDKSLCPNGRRLFRLSKKVPSSRHVRMDGTHTGKLSAESVRAALRRVHGSALNFVPRGIPGGRNFCPAYAGRNGFPLERVADYCTVSNWLL